MSALPGVYRLSRAQVPQGEDSLYTFFDGEAFYSTESTPKKALERYTETLKPSKEPTKGSLSGWQSEDSSPVDAGLYMRLEGNVETYAYWDRQWYCSAFSPEGAIAHYNSDRETSFPNLPWKVITTNLPSFQDGARKPEESGIYLRKAPVGMIYSYWDRSTNTWYSSARNLVGAMRNYYSGIVSAYQNYIWQLPKVQV